jgi:hypothetical protein
VQVAASLPQLGILSVAAVLEGWGDKPHLIDANATYLEYADQPGALTADGFAEHLAETAVQSNADLYGFSSICSTFPLSIRAARAVKNLRPHAMILFGGPQASVVDAATLAAFSWVDFILRGEVEESLTSLLQELHRDYDFSHVCGLTYREGNTVKRNPNAPVIEDLDALPLPAYHLSNYLAKATSASIELGRGCPFSCTFCSTNDFFRRKFRLRSPARVLREMREIAAAYGIQHFELVHDMFTVDRKRVVAFCEAMLACDDDFTWKCSARTDCVDRELLELMARSGCRSVFFGIETGSQKMQRVIDKDLDLERAKQMLDIAEEVEMKTTVSLITGFPEEDWQDVRDTIKIFTCSARHSRSHPQLNILAPLAGTPVHAAHKDKMVLEDLCSDMSHQGLTQSEQDLALIRNHPDIFPNFYMIPAKNLDRDVLFELREFLSMTVERFRWLLCSIEQATDLLHFLEEWRAWRTDLRGDLIGSDLRRYYVGGSVRGDFLRFMSGHPLMENPAIFAFVRADEMMMAAGETQHKSCVEGIALAAGEPLWMEDVPCARSRFRILKLHSKFEEIVASIAARTELAHKEEVFYATRIDDKGVVRLVEISNPLATVIEMCDGSRSVGGVFDRLSYKLFHLDEEARSYVASRLLAGAHASGFVKIYRTNGSSCSGLMHASSENCQGNA